jgi:hypothetical protein
MIEMKGDQIPEEEVVEAMRLAHTYVLQLSKHPHFAVLNSQIAALQPFHEHCCS